MVVLTAIGSVQLTTSLQTFLRSYHNNYYGACVRCSSTSTKQKRLYSVANLYNEVLINTPEGKIMGLALPPRGDVIRHICRIPTQKDTLNIWHPCTLTGQVWLCYLRTPEELFKHSGAVSLRVSYDNCYKQRASALGHILKSSVNTGRHQGWSVLSWELSQITLLPADVRTFITLLE